MTTSCRMYIDGAFREGGDGARFTSVDPATHEIWASFPEATVGEVHRAVQAGQAAFREGPRARVSARERGRVLERIAREPERAARHAPRFRCSP